MKTEREPTTYVCILHANASEIMDHEKFSFVGSPESFFNVIEDDECFSCAGRFDGENFQPKFSFDLKTLLKSVFGPDVAESRLSFYGDDIHRILFSVDHGWVVELYYDLLMNQKPASGKTIGEVCDHLETRMLFYKMKLEGIEDADV